MIMTIPCTGIHTTVCIKHTHTPGAVIQGRLLDTQPRGCQHGTIRLRNALGEMFPTAIFFAPALFQLWRYRPWKSSLGGGDIIHRSIRHSYCCTLKLPYNTQDEDNKPHHITPHTPGTILRYCCILYNSRFCPRQGGHAQRKCWL